MYLRRVFTKNPSNKALHWTQRMNPTMLAPQASATAPSPAAHIAPALRGFTRDKGQPPEVITHPSQVQAFRDRPGSMLVRVGERSNSGSLLVASSQSSGPTFGGISPVRASKNASRSAPDQFTSPVSVVGVSTFSCGSRCGFELPPPI